jgi:carbonic anhydrase
MLTSSEMLVALRGLRLPTRKHKSLMISSRRKDSIRSLVISQRLLGTREIAVFHHTDCGMLTFTTTQLQEKLKASAEGKPDAEKVTAAAEAIQFLEFSDLDKSVKEEVKFAQEHPLILNETEVTGWVYHVESGKVCCKCVVRMVELIGPCSDRFVGWFNHPGV